MFLLLTVSCLATSALANICCPPSQWEATETTLVLSKYFGQYHVNKRVTFASYDGENNRTSLAFNITMMFGREARLHIITDFAAGKQYIVYNDSVCFSMDTCGGFQAQCIKDYYTLLNTGALGIGDNTLSTSTYLEKDLFGKSMLTVTEACTPVILSRSNFFSNNMETTLYTDVRAGIVDTNVFRPPESCDQEEFTDEAIAAWRKVQWL